MCHHKTQIPVIILIMMSVTLCRQQPLCNYSAGTDHKRKLQYANIYVFFFSTKAPWGAVVYTAGGISAKPDHATHTTKGKSIQVPLGFIGVVQIDDRVF